MSKKLKVICIVFVCLAVVFNLVGCSGSTESDPSDEGSGNDEDKVYTLKMSTQLSEGTPFVKGFNAWAEAVKERSDGKLIIEVYPGAALGSDEDVIEQALQGVNVAVLTDGGRMANYVKDIGIINTAYIAENYEEMVKIVESDTFKEWTSELSSKHGIEVLNFGWFDGPRHFLTNKPIYSPSDLEGVLIRTPGADVWSKSIEALGATPVSTVGWAEVYNAVQSKVIDGAEGQTSASYPAALHEVLNTMSQTGHFLLMNGIIVGEKWLSSLPEEYKTILIEECAIAAENASKEVIENASVFEAEMAKAGMTIIPPEEIDIEAFKKASDKAYEELGFVELREKIYKDIGKK
ncbi:MAG TPA: TRAP transporter substrate-binding protein DctP [Eubacteriaceae bacterium]|nr:TRAP transporter substrate-binding protein DctP [Eubacteriaceae bacterium]